MASLTKANEAAVLTAGANAAWTNNEATAVDGAMPSAEGVGRACADAVQGFHPVFVFPVGDALEDLAGIVFALSLKHQAGNVILNTDKMGDQPR